MAELTHEMIISEPPGRRLDGWVAECLGWQWRRTWTSIRGHRTYYRVLLPPEKFLDTTPIQGDESDDDSLHLAPPYSTRWPQMGKLLGELIEDGMEVELLWDPKRELWAARYGDSCICDGDTASHAMARLFVLVKREL